MREDDGFRVEKGLDFEKIRGATAAVLGGGVTEHQPLALERLDLLELLLHVLHPAADPLLEHLGVRFAAVLEPRECRARDIEPKDRIEIINIIK